MNKEIEELRTELKSKIDEVINNYMLDDNALLNIDEDKIYMDFNIDDQNYIAFTEDSNDSEELNMMFAKYNIVDNKRVLRNIENAEEYQRVLNEYYNVLQEVA